MPRGDGDNLFKRDGVWYARIQVRGRDVRRSLRTSSRAEAKKRLPAVLAQAEHFRFFGESRHTWKEAVVEWAKEAGGSLKRSTLKRYLVSLGQLRGFMDDLYVDEISSRTVSQAARRAGASNSTRRRDITAISAVLRWCVVHNWREDNPARAFDRSIIRERRDPIVLPEDAAISAVIASAPGNFARMIQFAQYTGMRQEEIASLEHSDIDPRRRAVQLTRTKTSRPRSVPLDDRALGTLAGTPQRLGSAVVFWHGAGDRYLNVASRFAAIVRKAGVRRFRFHDLRHWFAVDYLRRGGSIYQLQQILGHSSIKTTVIYLAYLTPDEQNVAKAKGASE